MPVGSNEGAKFVAKGLVLGAIAQIHGACLRWRAAGLKIERG